MGHARNVVDDTELPFGRKGRMQKGDQGEVIRMKG